MCTCIYVYNAFNALDVHEESTAKGILDPICENRGVLQNQVR